MTREVGLSRLVPRVLVWLGVLGATLAVAAQLTLGAAAVSRTAAASDLAALDAASTLCSGHRHHGGAPSPRHAPDAALCPAAAVFAAPVLLVARGPAASPVRRLVAQSRPSPPARAPPRSTSRPGLARAPPDLA